MTEKGRFTIPTRPLIRVQSVFHPWLDMEELQVPKIIDLFSVSFRAFRGSTPVRVAMRVRRGPAEGLLVLAEFDNLARLTGLSALLVQRAQGEGQDQVNKSLVSSEC